MLWGVDEFWVIGELFLEMVVELLVGFAFLLISMSLGEFVGFWLPKLKFLVVVLGVLFIFSFPVLFVFNY